MLQAFRLGCACITRDLEVGRPTTQCQARSEFFNSIVRLNSATGYITPKDMLAGRQQEIHAERDRKWAGMRRALKRGGLLIIQGYTPKQLDYGTGGPKAVEQLYTRAMLEQAFGDFADVTITGPARPIMGLLLGLLELADAKASGVTCQGDPAILDRLAARTDPAVALA